MSSGISAHTDTASVHLYQIAYSDATKVKPGDGCLQLDNFANERPDWYEYWPVRNFLLTETLDPEAFYGFLSPKFQAKTNLTYAAARAFVEQHAADVDVVLFSPQPDMGAFFLNVFEQAELFDPGIIDVYGAFLASIGRSLPLRQMVMDSRHVVFSNYFVARPAFWREWLALNEALFAVCEGPSSALRDAFVHETSYPGAVQRKVFLQERAASLLLASQDRWRSIAYNPFDMCWSGSRLREFPKLAVASDALKMAFRDHRYPQYLNVFSTLRQTLEGKGSTDLGVVPDVPARDLPVDFQVGDAIKVKHSLWVGDLIVGPDRHRLRHATHHTTATYSVAGDFLVVDWDDYPAELYRRVQDHYEQAAPAESDPGLTLYRRPHTVRGRHALEIDAVSVRLPGRSESVLVRPATSDVPVFDAIYLAGDYDTPYLNADCEVIVDLGANTGLAAVYFATRCPNARIIAVEPARSNFRILVANAQDRRRIIPVEAAIWPNDGTIDLQDLNEAGQPVDAWAFRTVDGSTLPGGYSVEAISMPTLMARYGIGIVDVLKVDIEGAEYDVFAAPDLSWLSKIRVILVETHERFCPGVEDLVSRVLEQDFLELTPLGENRVFVRRETLS